MRWPKNLKRRFIFLFLSVWMARCSQHFKRAQEITAFSTFLGYPEIIIHGFGSCNWTHLLTFCATQIIPLLTCLPSFLGRKTRALKRLLFSAVVGCVITRSRALVIALTASGQKKANAKISTRF